MPYKGDESAARPPEGCPAEARGLFGPESALGFEHPSGTNARRPTPKLQHYWSLTIRLFNVIPRTLIGEVLPICRDAVGVFYSPNRLGNCAVVPDWEHSSCDIVPYWVQWISFNVPDWIHSSCDIVPDWVLWICGVLPVWVIKIFVVVPELSNHM